MPTLTAVETGVAVDLDSPERLHWLIGRGKGCDLVVNDAGASRYHATVFRSKDLFFLLGGHGIEAAIHEVFHHLHAILAAHVVHHLIDHLEHLFHGHPRQRGFNR